MACEILGLDGRAVPANLPRDGCCPPSICTIDWCGLICNFIQMLPRGPLWDAPKAYRLSQYEKRNAPVGCAPFSCDEGGCITIVDHSIYTARRLLDALFGALWPAIRESDPFTAHDTLDEWLVRLGWIDCYDCACRDPDMVGLSPIEVLGYVDGCEVPICCPPDYPEELRCAVKQGIVRALARLQSGIVRNLDGINFVIEPLGARLEPVCRRRIPLDPTRCHEDDGTTLALCVPEGDGACRTDGDPYACPSGDDCAGHETLGSDVCAPTMAQFEFRVCPTGDSLPKCVPLECPRVTDEPAPAHAITMCAPAASPTVKAYHVPSCDDAAGLPSRIWPGVMAAECIVRSLMPPGARISLTRCC